MRRITEHRVIRAAVVLMALIICSAFTPVYMAYQEGDAASSDAVGFAGKMVQRCEAAGLIASELAAYSIPCERPLKIVYGVSMPGYMP